MSRVSGVILGVLLAAPAFAAAPFDGNSWWSTVKVLADDSYAGRDTGSIGEREAQAYIVARLVQLRLAPAGSDGYYQAVALRTRALIETDSSLALVRDGKEQPLVFGEDALLSTRFPLARTVDAPLAFVGYGLDIPQQQYSDFSDIDVNGKVAVFIAGSPAEVPSAIAAHAQLRAERCKALRKAGAIGFVTLQNPASVEMSWARVALNRLHPSMDLDGVEIDESAGCQLAVVFNHERGQILFEGSGHTLAEIAALATERKPLPHFALLASIRAKAHTVSAQVLSHNVIAKIEGSDPALRDSYVVLSAHIDHLGVGESIDGTPIYNGAMDNGSGSALLLDLARALSASHAKPKRSILFLWVTAEEKGLLGSRYYAEHPTVPASALVADLNVDMFLPIIPLKILTVYGLRDSDLGDRVARVAHDLGLRVQPDPAPERNVFIRSDQYSFMKVGVPSLMLDVGAERGSAEAKVLSEWHAKRYHSPSDDSRQPVNLRSAAVYEDVVQRLLLSVANDPARPKWKPDSAFRQFAPAASVAR